MLSTNTANHVHYNLKGGGTVDFYPGFLSKTDADLLWDHCKVGGSAQLPWNQDHITVGQRSNILEPRFAFTEVPWDDSSTLLTSPPPGSPLSSEIRMVYSILTVVRGMGWVRSGTDELKPEKTMTATKWPQSVDNAKAAIEAIADQKYNVVLMNWYQNGDHHVSWHSDSETDLIDGASIATLSLGETYEAILDRPYGVLTVGGRRTFQLRANEDAHMGTLRSALNATKKPAADYTDEEKRIFSYEVGKDPTLNMKIDLKHGDLMIMGGTLQKFWRHRVPKETADIGPRIVLTFRAVAKDLV